MSEAGPIIALVEDDDMVRHANQQALALAGFAVLPYSDGAAAFKDIDRSFTGIVVSDVKMARLSGLALQEKLHAVDPELPVILVTGHGDIAMAVQAVQSGAYDFIEKPFAADRLIDVCRRALDKRRLVIENRRLARQLDERNAVALIGQSAPMQAVRRLIGALGPTSASVLIVGETGTGKEVVARAIHAASGRKGPFVALNCGALPESVFESELFGHEAGAFTGALKRRIGRIEYANRGTLFLDEIETMPLNLQVKLLRVLQDHEIERLGENKPIRVDIRVVAASKADLIALSNAGGFRTDLFYRLNVAVIDLPPLRSRREDILLLMAFFLSEAAGRLGVNKPDLSQADGASLMAREWPGNVRELRNAAERLCLGLGIGPEDPVAMVEVNAAATPLPARVHAYERLHILTAMDRHRGNVSAAADDLGIPKKTLYDKLVRHGLAAKD